VESIRTKQLRLVSPSIFWEFPNLILSQTPKFGKTLCALLVQISIPYVDFVHLNRSGTKLCLTSAVHELLKHEVGYIGALWLKRTERDLRNYRSLS
jgi:hypothetical protein